MVGTEGESQREIAIAGCYVVCHITLHNMLILRLFFHFLYL